MRIEKLTNDKIKVTLTASDLVNLDIDVKSLSPDSKELHTFLFHIMETIREETGFNPYSGQVVVEATPSEEGISIMVSRMRALPPRITREEIKRGVSVKAKSKKTRGVSIFYFDVFDDLCAALRQLKRDELLAGSLYKLGGTYCFIIEKSGEFKRCASVMTEFSAKRSRYPLQLTYIKEHGSLIVGGEALYNMAENLRSLV